MNKVKQFLVRKIVLNDSDKIFEIEKIIALSPWSRNDILNEIVIEIDSFNIAVEFEGKMSGFLFCRFVAGEAEIMNLGVDPNHQRQGIASLMIRNFFQICKEKGIGTVFLEVSNKNKKAIGLYKKLNFIQNGIRKAYYKNGNDALLFFINI